MFGFIATILCVSSPVQKTRAVTRKNKKKGSTQKRQILISNFRFVLQRESNERTCRLVLFHWRRVSMLRRRIQGRRLKWIFSNWKVGAKIQTDLKRIVKRNAFICRQSFLERWKIGMLKPNWYSIIHKIQKLANQKRNFVLLSKVREKRKNERTETFFRIFIAMVCDISMASNCVILLNTVLNSEDSPRTIFERGTLFLSSLIIISKK